MKSGDIVLDGATLTGQAMSCAQAGLDVQLGEAAFDNLTVRHASMHQ